MFQTVVAGWKYWEQLLKNKIIRAILSGSRNWRQDIAYFGALSVEIYLWRTFNGQIFQLFLRTDL